MSDQYYRFFPGDYIRDTGDLTMIEHGAYRLLLDNYYVQGHLPADLTRLYRMCRAFTAEEQNAINIVVARYFRENGNGNLTNRKAEKEIANRKAFLDEQARKSRLGVEARRRTQRIEKIQPDNNPRVDPKVNPKVNPPSPSPSLKNTSLIHTISKNNNSCSSSDELFDLFWKNYPKKIGKDAARRAWKKIKHPAEVIEKLKVTLPKQKQSEQWTKENGQYIPYPATYLNEGRWQDETII